MKEKILIVDDEKEIADLLSLYMKAEDYDVYVAYNGSAALNIIRKEKISLALLDIMLPDIDGFTLCKIIREAYYFPIIMLTAKIDHADRINGLVLGADDYITKPFYPLEVVTRVKAQLRRCALYDHVQSSNEYQIRGVSINKDTHKCFLDGEEIFLTPIEFDILWYLCSKQGKIVSSEELFQEVWKEDYLESQNTVMAHIARLREKMKEVPRKPKYIQTVWGVGYKIE